MAGIFEGFEKLRPLGKYCTLEINIERTPEAQRILLTNMPAGPLEKYQIACHDAGFYNSVGITATHTMPDNPSLLKPQVYAACATLIAEYPILSAIPIRKNKRSGYFVQLPEIDLLKTVSFLTRKATRRTYGHRRDEELDNILEAQHNLSFTPSSVSDISTFWRLLIILDPEDQSIFDVAFIYHHAIGDGRSGLVFHKAFATALASSGGTPLCVPTEVTPPKRPIPPAMESLLKIPMSPAYILKELFFSIFPKQNRGVWLGSLVPTSIPPKSRYRSIVFSKNTTDRLVILCRQRNTTMSAVLQTQLAKTLFDLLPPSFRKVVCEGAASARRWIQSETVNDDSIGCFVAVYSDTYSRTRFSENEFPWDIAQWSRENIAKFIATRGRNSRAGLLRFVPDIFRTIRSHVGKPRNCSFGISNIGVVSSKGQTLDNISESGNSAVRMGRVVFSQSGSYHASPFEICVVTGSDGCMTVGFAWPDAGLEEELLFRIMDSFKHDLEHLASG